MGEINNNDVNENEIRTNPETSSEVPGVEATEADHVQLEPKESENDDNCNDEARKNIEGPEVDDIDSDDPKSEEDVEDNNFEDFNTNQKNDILDDEIDDPKTDEEIEKPDALEDSKADETSVTMKNDNFDNDPDDPKMNEDIADVPNNKEPNEIAEGDGNTEDAEKSSDVEAGSDAELTPMQELSSYMNDHNYGLDDFDEYSKDSEWQRLHKAAFPDWKGRPEMSKTEESPNNQNDLSGEDKQEISGNLLSGQELLDRFGTEHHRYGSDYFVKGNHYDQFENDYYSPDASSYTKYEVPVQRDISPELIEGIHLGKREVEDPSIFWGQHERDGTAESFQEIASHIPEVRERLAAGDTLDDLAEDKKLSDCANIYFRNMPEIVERDGYYEFDSNGRHRILAARAIGENIPVKVIGKRT